MNQTSFASKTNTGENRLNPSSTFELSEEGVFPAMPSFQFREAGARASLIIYVWQMRERNRENGTRTTFFFPFGAVTT